MAKSYRETVKETLKAEIKEKLKKEMRKEIWEDLHKNEEKLISELKSELENEKTEELGKMQVIAGIEGENGIKLELDWDDTFIEYLRENGYTGVDDNAIIQKYLLSLTKQIAGDLKEEEFNEFE